MGGSVGKSVPAVVYVESRDEVKGPRLEAQPCKYPNGETCSRVIGARSKATAILRLCPATVTHAAAYRTTTDAEGCLFLLEQRPNGFDLLRNGHYSGYLYGVRGASFWSCNDVLCASSEPARIVDRVFVADVWQALQFADIVLVRHDDLELRRWLDPSAVATVAPTPPVTSTTPIRATATLVATTSTTNAAAVTVATTVA